MRPSSPLMPGAVATRNVPAAPASSTANVRRMAGSPASAAAPALRVLSVRQARVVRTRRVSVGAQTRLPARGSVARDAVAAVHVRTRISAMSVWGTRFSATETTPARPVRSARPGRSVWTWAAPAWGRVPRSCARTRADKGIDPLRHRFRQRRRVEALPEALTERTQLRFFKANATKQIDKSTGPVRVVHEIASWAGATTEGEGLGPRFCCSA